MKLEYWVAKGFYNIGDYKASLDLANKKVDILLEKYKDLDKEFTSLQGTEKEKIVSTI
jgi:predicted ribonuclease toxin of YeeF-YezG toxin-antitoxin module